MPSSQTVSRVPPRAESSGRRRAGPAFTLVLLAPIIAELLYGSTRVSFPIPLIPQFMTWGCGALLIRECIWRWRKGWPAMLLMGVALAVAEEIVIQQTSIAPLVRLGQHAYGRVWGVNWVYLLWALGYESVWVVLLPVQLTELMFPDRRGRCWLRARGLVIVSVIFVLGALAAWYGWTQRARVKVFHMAPYSPPPLYLLVGAAVILLLILAARVLPSRPRDPGLASRPAPSSWTVELVTCFLGLPWAAFVVLGWGAGALPALPFQAALAVGIAWAALAFFIMRRWTSSADWTDAHRFALVFGGVLACMLGGFVVFAVGGARHVDWIGKILLNGVAVAWLISLGRAIDRRRIA